MSSVHREYVSDQGYAKLVFVRQIQAIKTINQLRATSDFNLLRMTVERVECHPAEYCVPQGGQLFELIAGCECTARPVPRSPLVNHEFHVMFGVELAHNLPVSL